MSNLSQAKTYGGIGAILMLVGGFANITGYGGIISIIGLVLVFVAVKEISQVLNNSQIKSDYLMSIILSIISFLVLMVGLVAFIFTMTDFTMGDITSNPTDPFGAVGDSLAICVVVIIVFILLQIVSAIYFKKCFDAIGEGLNIEKFKTAGKLNLIGAFTMIILVGFFFFFIAQILLILAFFSIEENPSPAVQQGQGRVCPNCGRPIPMDAQVCPYCGKDFRQQ